MKKMHRILALLLVLSLLLCGCKGEEESEGQAKMGSLLQSAQSVMAGGGFHFTGKVLGKATEDRLITYYDADMGENTFYSVEITEDPYGCLPDRTVTVGILGNAESFPNRTPLAKGKEYYFQTYLWVEGEEIIFLLPTFYTSLAEREAGMIYTTVAGTRYSCGTEEEFLKGLKAAEAQAEYGPKLVWEYAASVFESASERSNAAKFAELEIEVKNPEALQKTESTAKALLEATQKTEKTWEGLGGLIK